jgi:prevent-host-death family protein
MTTYSVADAKNGLPRLIDLALEGQEVIISRHGKPVAELRPIRATAQAPAKATHEWLKSRLQGRPVVPITSLQLLDEMYEDPEG